MNEPTQRIIGILQNIRKLKPMLDVTRTVDKEVHLYFNSDIDRNFRVTYIVSEDDFDAIDWYEVHTKMGYKVNDMIEGDTYFIL